MKNRICQRLFSPAQIGGMRLNNRTVMAPMVTQLAGESGAVTQRMLDYYDGRSKGGVGLVIVEAAYVASSGKGFPCQLGIDRDGVLPGHYELAEAIHRYGAKAAIQIYHGGANANPASCGGTLVGPSAVMGDRSGVVPRELTVEEIKEIGDAFAQAAERAKRAGYDAVELHGAHGFLIHQFLSPASNRRADEYGGSFENRLRFARLVVSRVRELAGARFPVIFRMSAEGGYGLEEAVEIAAALEHASVDCIHVSIGGTAPTTLVPTHTSPMAIPEGYLAPHAAAIKGRLSIPVIAVGEIRHPPFAEEMLAQGQADFIALARQFLADPEWPRKASAGLDDEIKLCISCDYCRLSLRHSIPIRCLVNPSVGRERELAELKPARRLKRVAVVGGGPAGMEAARVAAIRGHTVTLYEKDEKLGGQLWLAAAPPGKEKIHWLRENLEAAILRAGVRIRASETFTAATLDRDEADVVIVATGARAIALDAPGAEGDNVLSSHHLLQGEVQVEGKRVVVLGGRQVGCETAEYLTERGCTVTVVARSPASELAADAVPTYRTAILGRLRDEGVTFINEHDVQEVHSDGIVLVGRDGQTRELSADLIVVARGSVAESALVEELRDKADKAYAIGDCVEPRTIAEALYEATLIASRI